MKRYINLIFILCMMIALFGCEKQSDLDMFFKAIDSFDITNSYGYNYLLTQTYQEVITNEIEIENRNYHSDDDITSYLWIKENNLNTYDEEMFSQKEYIYYYQDDQVIKEQNGSYEIFEMTFESYMNQVEVIFPSSDPLDYDEVVFEKDSLSIIASYEFDSLANQLDINIEQIVSCEIEMNLNESKDLIAYQMNIVLEMSIITITFESNDSNTFVVIPAIS